MCAPYSGDDYAIRWSFYDVLSSFVFASKCHGPIFVMGDFNARAHIRRPREEEIVGGYAFGNDHAGTDLLSNRSLLMELCDGYLMMISNTFFD